MFGPPAYSEPPEYYIDSSAEEQEFERLKQEILAWSILEYLEEFGVRPDQSIQECIDNGVLDEACIEERANFVLRLTSEKTSEDDPPWIENSHIYWTRRERNA